MMLSFTAQLWNHWFWPSQPMVGMLGIDSCVPLNKGASQSPHIPSIPLILNKSESPLVWRPLVRRSPLSPIINHYQRMSTSMPHHSQVLTHETWWTNSNCIISGSSLVVRALDLQAEMATICSSLSDTGKPLLVNCVEGAEGDTSNEKH